MIFPTDSFFSEDCQEEWTLERGQPLLLSLAWSRMEIFIILFGGAEYSNEHTREEWKILTGITKLLIYCINCIFGSNVTRLIVKHRCRFCSVLMGQDSMWYILLWIAHLSKVSKLSLTEATEVLFLLQFLLLEGAYIILHLSGSSFPVHQVFLSNLLCVRYSSEF